MRRSGQREKCAIPRSEKRQVLAQLAVLSTKKLVDTLQHGIEYVKLKDRRPGVSQPSVCAVPPLSLAAGEDALYDFLERAGHRGSRLVCAVWV